MFVYRCDNIEVDIDKILVEHKAIKLGDDYLLSRLPELTIGEKNIPNDATLEEFILSLDEGDEFYVIEGINVSLIDVLNIYVGELNQEINDKGDTYIERIYSSHNPYAEIEKNILHFLLLKIDFIKAEINKNINKKLSCIERKLDKGDYSWKKGI